MDNVDASPDGYWLAFDYWYFNVLSDIYLMTFPGANLIQMTEHPAMDYDPVWRPIP
jgi:Tol biopolymer transport system component